MTGFSSAPIRRQLLLLAFVLTLPALGIIIYSGLKMRTTDYRQSAIESQKLADHLTAELVDIAHEAEQFGGILSDLPDVKNRNTDKVQAIISKTIKRYPQYSAVLIADENGMIWASTYPVPADTSVADRLYFRKARLTKRYSSGEYVLTKKSKTPSIHLAYPLLEKTEFRGAVIIAINLDMLKSILGRSQLSANTNYVITDHTGIIISRGRNIGQEVGKPIQPADLKRMENGPDKETYEFTRMDGDRRITTYRKVRLEGEQSPFLYVRAGLSVKEAVANANLNLAYNIAFLLPFVLSAFVLAIFIGKRSIVDRIVTLQKAAEQIAGGDLNTRVSHLLQGGELGRLAATFDVMAQKLADDLQTRMEAAEEYRAIIKTTSDGFNVCDAQGRFLDANAAYCSIVGFSREELMAMTLADLEANENPEKIQEHIRHIIAMGSDSFTSKHKRKDGSTVDVEVTVTYLNEHGGRFYSFVRDIADRKKLEAELLRAATYDRLTGVLNRQALEDRILKELERAKRYGKAFSLILLDIDDFKNVNDSFGHQAGDKVLVGIAGLLSQHVRVVDSVGRWGGEEFVILLTESKGQEAALVAEKLRTTLAEQRIEGVASVTASFGVSQYQKEDTLDSIIKRVDALLYRAKNRGKNQVETAAN